jgi:hypothetical protein
MKTKANAKRTMPISPGSHSIPSLPRGSPRWTCANRRATPPSLRSNRAINKVAVPVFPGQFIIDEQQMAFSRQLGDLETTVAVHRRDYMPRLDVDVADISNLNHKNQVRTKDDRLRLNALANRLWRSDSSFKRIPARFPSYRLGPSPTKVVRPSSPTCAPGGTRCPTG